MKILSIQDTITKTSAFDGSPVAVSTLDASIGWTLVLEIRASNPGTVARFDFADSTDNFGSDILAGPSFVLDGSVTVAHTVRTSWQSFQFPDLRVGVAGAKLRLSVSRITGSVSYVAWIERGD